MTESYSSRPVLVEPTAYRVGHHVLMVVVAILGIPDAVQTRNENRTKFGIVPAVRFSGPRRACRPPLECEGSGTRRSRVALFKTRGTRSRLAAVLKSGGEPPHSKNALTLPSPILS